MIKRLPLLAFLVLLLGACTANAPSSQGANPNGDQPTMVVYRSPT